MARIFDHVLTSFRIWLCARQVVINTQSLTPAQGARLSLMIAHFRASLLDVPVPGGSATINEMVQHPMAFRSDLCYAAFSLLSDIRQASREEIKSYASFKVSPNPQIKEHTEICDLALSLLMSTLGVGCQPSTLEPVKYAWDYLATFPPGAADIALILNMPERIVNDLIGQPLTTWDWLELAGKRPDFLKSMP
jgi:hypothetical protein